MRIEWQPILLANGIFISILACAMLLPALVDVAYDNPDWQAFLMGFFVTFFLGVGLYLINRGYRKPLNIRQAFLLTASCWVTLPFFAALPFYFADIQLNFINAWFESVSALTTTGATVMSGLDAAPPGILLWRSLLQWLGGIGIIALAVAILPMLKIGGMQLFRTESSDKSEKVLPRARQISTVIGSIYLFFTGLCALLLWMVGLDGFDAINHAMTTVATAGFSTYDTSIAHFDNKAAEAIIIVFMLMSALPFILYFQFVRGRQLDLLNDTQVHTFLTIWLIAVVMVTLWLWHTDVYANFGQAFRYAAFNVTSVATTTGYASADFNLWGGFAVTFLFLFCVLGGCTGSTTGGIKIFRLQVLMETAKIQFGHLVRPHAVILPTFNGKTIELSVVNAVMSYCLLFAVCFMVLASSLSLFGLDYITCMSGAASMLANLGPALGDIIGPSGSYAPLPDGAKILLALGMMLGRLELFTILVLCAPAFWKD